ncbi:unnamed protein product, partial [Meganyctiphanes norvegica]
KFFQFSMAWRDPKTLQQCAAASLVVPLIKATEDCLRTVVAKIPSELIITRATAGLLLHNETENENGRSEAHCGPAENLDDISDDTTDIMDIALTEVKGCFVNIRMWWCSIPGINMRPGGSLRQALDIHTEVHPQQDSDFIRNLSRQLLKVLLLQNVFLDRDYGDKDKCCLIPFAWERWTAKLVRNLAPFPQVEMFKVYGGVYPSILSAILMGLHNLKELYISHINITDEILLATQRSCPSLQTLMLHHSYPWQVISMAAFCSAFFKGATKKELAMARKDISEKKITLSFPHLRNIELGYGEISVAKEFHTFLLSFYRNLENLICDWKTNIFEDGYASHSVNILLPMIRKGMRLSLKQIFIDAGTLHLLGRDQLNLISKSCPDVSKVTLECSARGPKLLWESAGKRLAEMSKDWQYLSSLQISVASENRQTSDLIFPLLFAKGDSISDLTIEASTLGQKFDLKLLKMIVNVCPLLTRLKVGVWSIAMVECTEDTISFPESTKLQEIWLHEDGFEGNANTIHIHLWIKLMEALISSAVNLHTLSVSLSRNLEPILDKIYCNASNVHLHVKDGYEWQPDIEKICKLLTHLPSIQEFYLEEVSGCTFWKLRRCYNNSSLRLHWGNMYGWPRS